MGKWRAAPSRTVGPRVMQSRLHAGGIPFAASDAAPHRHAVRQYAAAGGDDRRAPLYTPRRMLNFLDGLYKLAKLNWHATSRDSADGFIARRIGRELPCTPPRSSRPGSPDTG